MKNNLETSKARSKALAATILRSNDWPDLKIAILCNINDHVGLPEVKRALAIIEDLGDDSGQIQEGKDTPESPKKSTIIKSKHYIPEIKLPIVESGIDPDLQEN